MSDLKTKKRHLQKMKNAGVNWVRVDVRKPIENCTYLFKAAHGIGLKVIGVIKSRTMLKGLGVDTEKYLPGSDWARKWGKSIEQAASALVPYIEIWQIDNELNHPWHNPIPSINAQLATDIIESGVNALRSVSPNAKTAANLFYEVKSPISILDIGVIQDEPFILKYKENLKDKIDILGLDIYRGTWHLGTPADYKNDLKRYHVLWGGDVMIMETGFCTGILGRSEAHQANHVKQVFNYLDNYIKNIPWFTGIMWYVYKSSHLGIPCENSFGLHKNDGFEEKQAWKEFEDCMKRYNQFGKILGLTYHG
ncbi:MAG: hypothetical protein JSV09_03300 [Thermoplasmata archaeon]|nr:MAG: hypothetical protein JSV09_03300 [Thermoplasmata archaeon]